MPASWVSGHLVNRCPKADIVLCKDFGNLFVSVWIMEAELKQQIPRNLTLLSLVGACYKRSEAAKLIWEKRIPLKRNLAPYFGSCSCSHIALLAFLSSFQC